MLASMPLTDRLAAHGAAVVGPGKWPEVATVRTRLPDDGLLERSKLLLLYRLQHNALYPSLHKLRALGRRVLRAYAKLLYLGVELHRIDVVSIAKRAKTTSDVKV